MSSRYFLDTSVYFGFATNTVHALNDSEDILNLILTPFALIYYIDYGITLEFNF